MLRSASAAMRQLQNRYRGMLPSRPTLGTEMKRIRRYVTCSLMISTRTARIHHRSASAGLALAPVRISLRLLFTHSLLSADQSMNPYAPAHTPRLDHISFNTFNDVERRLPHVVHSSAAFHCIIAHSRHLSLSSRQPSVAISLSLLYAMIVSSTPLSSLMKVRHLSRSSRPSSSPIISWSVRLRQNSRGSSADDGENKVWR